MELRYTRHAIARMIQQGISEAMVEAVLLSPSWTPQRHSQNIRYDALVDGVRLAVVVAPRDETIIVSVFWIDREV